MARRFCMDCRIKSGNDGLWRHPRLMNEREWFGKIVAS
jgi:hypothetical protein